MLGLKKNNDLLYMKKATLLFLSLVLLGSGCPYISTGNDFPVLEGLVDFDEYGYFVCEDPVSGQRIYEVVHPGEDARTSQFYNQDGELLETALLGIGADTASEPEIQIENCVRTTPGYFHSMFDVPEQAVTAALNNVLPEDPWRQIEQWKMLPNGNYWLWTSNIVTNQQTGETNPCGTASPYHCPSESWIVDLVNGEAYLSSSENNYLSSIDVTPGEIEKDRYLTVEWDIARGHETLDRTEYVNIYDGSLTTVAEALLEVD